jgi:tRNA threonylcarbamoyladenosine biosynthesis protein TsaE
MLPSFTRRLRAASPQQTRRIAERLGQGLTHGMVIAIRGELGSGKTCFVQGLARGLGIPAETYVTSPSYTLVNTYAGRLTLHHIDLYRLDNGAPDTLGLEELYDGSVVAAVEWPERMAALLPQERLEVVLEVGAADQRAIQMTGYGLAAVNLIKALPKDW